MLGGSLGVILPFGWGLEGERVAMTRRTLRRPCLVAFFLAAVAATEVAAQVPRNFHPNIALLNSPHATGKLSEEHVIEALWYAATDLRIPPENIPPIVVIHATVDNARMAEIPMVTWTADHASSGAFISEPIPNGGRLYYLWVIGKASDIVLAQGLVEILHKHNGLPKDQVASATRRLLLRLSSRVGVSDLQNGWRSSFARVP